MITASYFDGKSLQLHTVQLELSGGAIALSGDVIAKSYTRSQARMAEPFENAPGIIDFDDGARCELNDRDAKARVAAALGYRRPAVVFWQRHWHGALLALILLLGSIFAFVQYGVPRLVDGIVAGIPSSIDKKVGEQAMQSLDERMVKESRLSDERIDEIQRIFREVLPKQTRMPMTLHVVDMINVGPNAMALPNGAIYITDAMIQEIMYDVEADFTPSTRATVAGILAHEIAHVEGRHSMRALASASLLTIGSAALFGDFSAVVAGAPVLLMSLDYSRSMETQADEFAIKRLLELGMSPAPLADLFDELDTDGPDTRHLPKWMTAHTGYLSSHPASKERSARLRQAAEKLEAPAEESAPGD